MSRNQPALWQVLMLCAIWLGLVTLHYLFLSLSGMLVILVLGLAFVLAVLQTDAFP